MIIDFSKKQKTIWRESVEAPHRWNISYGATRSGKTYLDYFKLPYRIRNASDDGLILILGNTKGTLERNILDPLRKIWTPALVSNISSNNKVRLFGRECYALGADKINQVSKLQGSGLSYCYGDEIATWHEDVFTMLKSRLDKPTSCFDGTSNPDNPNHWLKKFLESDADIYQMKFILDDNPFNDPDFVRNLKNEYRGTVYYDRFILGDWKAAEGTIYRLFADNPELFIIDKEPENMWFSTIGVDWGGNASGDAFIHTGFTKGLQEVIILDEHYKTGVKSPDEIYKDYVDFVRKCTEGHRIVECRADSAEQTLIQGLKVASMKERIPIEIKNAIKSEINDRIRFICSLMAQGRFKIMRRCSNTVNALQSAVWDSKSVEDKRLDNLSYNMDVLDAMEYSTEKYMKDIQNARLIK